MKLIEIQDKLIKSRLKAFSSLEFRRLAGVSRIAAQKLLERYTQRGMLVRLKGGLYALKLNYPSGYLIANRLYEPSYISFETALAFYGLIPETTYSYTSATTKTTRTFLAGQNHFIYHKIKKESFLGYCLSTVAGDKVLMAEKEKALADYLYLVFLKKKPINSRLKINKINRKKLFFYVAYFGQKQFKGWVECLLKNK